LARASATRTPLTHTSGYAKLRCDFHAGARMVGPPNRGSMKLKNRDWTDVEQRLKAVDTPLLQQDRTVRAALLTLAIFGVAALTGIVGYLVWPYCIPGL
jgi:hypothetical protein